MKRKSATKVMALTLATVMTAGLLAGCGDDATGESGSSEQGSNAEQSSGESPEESQGGENTPSVDKNDPAATAASNGLNLPELDTLSITVRTANWGTDPTGTMIQQLWQEKMEAYLGCKLEIEWDIKASQQDLQDNENTWLQAGDMKDVNTTTVGTSLDQYGEDGDILNIADYSDYLVYYPDYMAGAPGGEDYAKNKDGSMYYFLDGSYNPDNITGAQSFAAFAYRFDVLKDNGWTPATTIEEFEQLCANIQAKINDGSIEAEYIIQGANMDLIRGFNGIFHTWESEFYNGSEWVYGPIEDNFREEMRFLNRLWEAGYIDPEYTTTDWNMALEKATNSKGLIMPSNWAGIVLTCNNALAEVEGNTMEWGLAYLPDGPEGTAWKWGSKLPGKSLSTNKRMGIFIDADTEHPEYVVAMIDYQYSDQMVQLLNWGVEGETFNVVDGKNVFVDEIANDESPSQKSADYGLMASALCRTGIPFTPQDNNAVIAVAAPTTEPWWSEEQGYYIGRYWVETGVNGGLDSVSPIETAPVVYLTPEQQQARAQLAQSGVCYKTVVVWADDFIQGKKDIDNDADWEEYVTAVKSVVEGDFDEILQMLNENTVK